MDKELIEKIIKNVISEMGLTSREDMARFLKDMAKGNKQMQEDMAKGNKQMQDKMRKELEEVVKDGIDEKNREYDEFKGFIRSKIEKVEEDWRKYQEHPLEKFDAGLSEEIGRRLEKKITEENVSRAIKGVLMRQLPAYISELAEKGDTIKGAVEKAIPLIEQELVKKLCKEEGIDESTVKDLGGVIKKIRKRGWTLTIAAAGSIALAVGLASYGIFYSSRVTAEGAAGVANQALAQTESLRKNFESYQRGMAEWQSQYDKKDEERKKEAGELERRMSEQINLRATGIDVANLKKNQAETEATLGAEIEKNKARDEAYNKFNDSMTKIQNGFGGLQTRVSELEMKLTDREYIDKGDAQIKLLYDNLAEGMLKYESDLKALRANNASLKDVEGLKTNYKNLENIYNSLMERVKKIEDAQPKKKEN